MDNRKFEQLIDLIINENEEQARALFHDIVVEKSREIYESIMDEETTNEDMSGGLLDEIGADIESDEEGMSEEEDEFADIDVDDEDGFGHESEEEEIDDLEDRVVDLEDKLDELMAEFEELMGHEHGEEHDMGDEEDFGDEEDMMEASEEDDEEDVTESKEEDDDEEDEEDMSESLEEAINLKQVPGLYGSKIGGDNGDNPKSVALTTGPRVKTNAKAVNFTGEADKGGTKGGLLSPDTKDVEHASQWKNAPAQGGMKLDKATKPHLAQATQVNTKSPVAESKKAKKRIK